MKLSKQKRIFEGAVGGRVQDFRDHAMVAGNQSKVEDVDTRCRFGHLGSYSYFYHFKKSGLATEGSDFYLD